MVVLEGAKVSDKLAVIANLIKTADTLVIGGGMAFTFLAAEGYEVGKSLLEQDQIETVRRYFNDAAAGGSRSCCRPTSWWRQGRRRRTPTVVPARAIPPDQIGLDIGPDSARCSPL